MIAYDPARTELWVICPRCAQWNLVPIEERDNAIREAESRFLSTANRHQSGEIGIARLPDGSSLVRIGNATSGELAAWRYGRRLVNRRRYALLAHGTARIAEWGGLGAFAAIGAPALAMGLPLYAALPAAAGVGAAVSFPRHLRLHRRLKLVLAVDPTSGVRIRRLDTIGARLVRTGEDPAIEIDIAALDVFRLQAKLLTWLNPLTTPVRIEGASALALARATLVSVNDRGGDDREIAHALEQIAQAGGSRRYLQQAADQRPLLPARLFVGRYARVSVPPVNTIALEIALNQELEAADIADYADGLRGAWTAAREIAEIADSLPDEGDGSTPRRR